MRPIFVFIYFTVLKMLGLLVYNRNECRGHAFPLGKLREPNALLIITEKTGTGTGAGADRKICSLVLNNGLRSNTTAVGKRVINEDKVFAERGNCPN